MRAITSSMVVAGAGTAESIARGYGAIRPEGSQTLRGGRRGSRHCANAANAPYHAGRTARSGPLPTQTSADARALERHQGHPHRGSHVRLRPETNLADQEDPRLGLKHSWRRMMGR